ncbi:hypothetical protein LQ772_05180 [Frateuria edaphi]|jgi:hypothetical protein|uniref:hypothetical protein n=1 Tax=Frateuria TaxID=70411 RepID=UPI001E3F067F|nr:hypothetical protein [Frateuria edaphi]UGB46691.1 hypothetical protein LQ772_05180 [Frateuria edaphi]
MDAIDILERAGSDASVFRGGKEALQAIIGTELDTDLAAALLASDAEALYRLLGQSILIGLQIPAEEEEAPDEDEDDAEERLPES